MNCPKCKESTVTIRCAVYNCSCNEQTCVKCGTKFPIVSKQRTWIDDGKFMNPEDIKAYGDSRVIQERERIIALLERLETDLFREGMVDANRKPTLVRQSEGISIAIGKIKGDNE